MDPPSFGWDRIWLFNLRPSPLPSGVLFHEDQWVLTCLPRAEEKLEMRVSIWCNLPFRSNHIIHELVNCCFSLPAMWCRKLGKVVAFLSLNFFCMLLSHPLHVSLLSLSLQPKGIRREKTQNSLICTEGKGPLSWEELKGSLESALFPEVFVYVFPSLFPRVVHMTAKYECNSSVPCYQIPVWYGAYHWGSICALLSYALML